MRITDTCNAKSPLEKGAQGVVKLPGKTQPPKSPFINGDLKGIT